jgi:hypothetical protein
VVSPIEISVEHPGIFLSVGDEVRIQLSTYYDAGQTAGTSGLPATIDGALTGNASPVVYSRLEDGAIFYNELQNKLADGVSISVNSCIPDDITLKDFILSIVNMFRLYMEIDTDNPNNYLIEPRNDWYNSTVVDWSDKLDMARGLEILPMSELQGKRYIFKYKDDKDYFNDLYQKTWLLDGKAETYGQKRVEVDNDFVTNDVIIQPIFSGTPLSDVKATSHNRIISCMFTYDAKENESKSIGTNIRILYWGGLKSFTGPQWVHTSVGAPVSLSTYPYAGHLDNPLDPNLDLSFSIPKEFYWAIKRELVTDATLYNVYHRRAIEEVTDINSKLVTGYFWLKPTDIFQLSFRKLYYFDGQYYRLNKIIDYDLDEEQLTKCEFILSKDPGAYVSSQGFVIGGGDEPIGGGGDIMPRPPAPPNADPFNNVMNTQYHVVLGMDNNVARSAQGVFVQGDSNIIGGGTANILILGDSNIVNGGHSNVRLINCSGLDISESDVMYINNCPVDSCPVDQSDIDTSFSARSGVATLADSTVHVVNPLVTPASVILITAIDVFVGMITVTASTGAFDINSSIVGETGDVNYFIASY